MSRLFYISHPEVTVDPQVPVPQWHLSEQGVRRANGLSKVTWLDNATRVYSSAETKAIETAEIIGQAINVSVQVREEMGENDRSSTGFVPPERFEQLANEFFGRPDQSVDGWERAIDAQERIVAATADLLKLDDGSDTVVVGHGGVGTLLYCHLTAKAIDRRHDQPSQGHYFTIEVASRPAPDRTNVVAATELTALHPWRRFEDRTTD